MPKDTLVVAPHYIQVEHELTLVEGHGGSTVSKVSASSAQPVYHRLLAFCYGGSNAWTAPEQRRIVEFEATPYDKEVAYTGYSGAAATHQAAGPTWASAFVVHSGYTSRRRTRPVLNPVRVDPPPPTSYPTSITCAITRIRRKDNRFELQDDIIDGATVPAPVVPSAVLVSGHIGFTVKP